VFPDWPDLKKDIAECLDEAFRNLVYEKLGPLGGIAQVQLFEGRA
jgi:hypothetical protein